ncbi:MULTISPECIES: ADP-ribosylglycohydrolase family protein [unclassified Massilia]|uniref:ADP-ribosylglycohydrolase family protein n=1 Tax=unclassified Massilia TaxID=2609279 RepID=UPI001782D65B|nr:MULTISPECIES: ADP-ribosylglycohydrolase family protein [unclassified Massilia]MBD8530532.1 ADP-ribosylglycohydrolase family protein [Massilia sp. CFBP 13647]MBD8674170.1 ADP-ribosylglycohydrolase family protein [Massilia sp. CFBP 13721]
MIIQERYRGALIGLACGDAVGTAVEFMPRGTFPQLTDMVGGGKFDLKPGEWTDDTSMALCLAHSLLYQQGFDPVDQMNRYCNWYNYGYMSSTGECFDIGYTTALALRRYLEDENPFAGSLDPDSAGNGALMRLAPIPMYYAQDKAAVFHFAGESTRTTHGTREAIECSRLFGLQLRAALCGGAKDEILSIAYPEPLSRNVAPLANGDFLAKPVEEIKGSGYCVQSLEAALWYFWHTASFKEAVLKAANLGDDADTTAAICGQLAGAFYGFAQIPDEWVKRLAMSDEIVGLSDRLLTERYASK